MVVFETISDFKKMVGKELPIGNWYTITQEMITDFANATLDKQWIHVDGVRALFFWFFLAELLFLFFKPS